MLTSRIFEFSANIILPKIFLSGSECRVLCFLPLARLLFPYKQWEQLQLHIFPMLMLLIFHLIPSHMHRCSFFTLLPVSGSCPEILQLFLHLHFCAGIGTKTYRLRLSSLLQRQVQCVFIPCVLTVWLCIRVFSLCWLVSLSMGLFVAVIFSCGLFSV